jgi:hypothetical protein
MKLLRYGPKGSERPALLDKEGKLRNLSGVISDLSGAALSSDSLAKLRGLNPEALPEVSDSHRIGPCVGSFASVSTTRITQLSREWPYQRSQ